MIPIKSEQTNLIREAIRKAKKEFPPITMSKKSFVGTDKKTGKPEFVDYASLEDILNGVEAILDKHGVTIDFSTAFIDGQHCSVTTLQHDSEQWMCSVYAMDSEGGRSAQQARGISYTYANRYTLKNMLCLKMSDETDNNGTPYEKKEPVPKTPLQNLWAKLYEVEDIEHRNQFMDIIQKKYNIKKINEIQVKFIPEAIALVDKYFEEDEE
jgi:hypothetical protein